MDLHKFDFTGTAKEYFGIWIVNLLLSIVTVGIYTAWAKVRRVRYFYANTHLDGHNFEYHARPKSILIGRIIVVGALLAYNLLLNVTPLAGILLIPYLFALPWIINKAIQFNARVTSYRNIRLNFGGSYWRAFLVFVVMTFAVMFTMGILGPVASRMASNYVGNNLKYGTAKFSTDAPLGALYGNWGASIGFFFIAAFLLGGVSSAIAWVAGEAGFFDSFLVLVKVPMGEEATFSAVMLGMLGVYISVIFVFLFYKAGVRNIAYNSTTLEGGHQFRSTVSRFKYVWILFSNLLATIFTFGVLRPWAAIRSWRYLARNTALLAKSDLADFVEQKTPEGAAASAEFLDIEGIDFGL